MPRTWKALPINPKSEVLLKAPDHRTFVKQQQAGDAYKPPKDTAAEVLTAHTLVYALDDDQVRIPQGKSYTVYRYAQGLAVGLPSGFTAYFPLEGQKLSTSGARSKGEPQSFQDPDQDGNPDPEPEPAPKRSSRRTPSGQLQTAH